MALEAVDSALVHHLDGGQVPRFECHASELLAHDIGRNAVAVSGTAERHIGAPEERIDTTECLEEIALVPSIQTTESRVGRERQIAKNQNRAQSQRQAAGRVPWRVINLEAIPVSEGQ